MPFQSEPKLICWKIHLSASPEQVYDLLSTNDGRAAFWAESAMELDRHVNFIFPNGDKFRGRVLEAKPNSAFRVEYLDNTTAAFKIESDGGKGSLVTLTADGINEADRLEWACGWMSVLMSLKAAADFGADLRNHDVRYTWDKGFGDN